MGTARFAGLKAALREIVAATGVDLVATPDQDILAVGLPPDARSTVDAILRRHGVRAPEQISAREKSALACPALPTCGLALAESERVLPSIVAEVDAILDRLSERLRPALHGRSRHRGRERGPV